MIERGRVYIVSHSATVRASLDARLANAGFKPQSFCSAKELLQILEFLEPGCILLDDEQLVWASVRDIQENLAMRSGTPLVLITDRDNFIPAIQTIKRGATDVIEKPVDMKRLTDALDSAICYVRVHQKEVLGNMVHDAKVTSEQPQPVGVATDLSKALEARLANAPLAEIQAFVVMAEEATLANAVAMIGGSKKAALQLIRSLEDRLAVQLFEHAGHLRPTTCAEEIYPYARAFVESVRDLSARLDGKSAHSDRPSGD